MAGDFTEGFDDCLNPNDLTNHGWDISGLNGAIFSAGGYFPNGSTYVGQCFQNPGGNISQIKRAITPTTKYTLGWARWNQGGGKYGHNGQFMQLSNNGTVLLGIGEAGSIGVGVGQITVTGADGTTQTINATNNLDSTWAYMEVSVTADAVAGTVIVRQDGSPVGTITIPTLTGTLTNFDTVAVCTQDVNGTKSQIDHIYGTNGEDDGTGMTGFIGPGIVQNLAVVLDSGTQTMTPLTGSSRADMLKEAVEDGLTSYVANTGPNQSVLCTIGPLDAAVGQVMMVTPRLAAQGSGNTLAAVISSAGTVTTTAYSSLAGTFGIYTPGGALSKDPATGTMWETAAVNALLIGATNGNP
jgi:hypothetical protein